MFTLDLVHRWTDELSGGLSIGCHLNKSEKGQFSAAAIDQTTLNISPRIRYEFSKDIALEGSYRYAFVKDKTADTGTKRNLVMIYVTIRHSLFE